MTDHEHNYSENPGAGQMLLAARKKAGRSLGDVAAELHINEAHLRLIENEEFSTVASPTFVKGYIRAYARALEIDPGPVMRAYLKVSGPVPQWKPTATIDEPVSDRSKLAMTYAAAGVAALLGIVLVAWLFTRDVGDAETPVTETEILQKAEVGLPSQVEVSDATAKIAIPGGNAKPELSSSNEIDAEADTQAASEAKVAFESKADESLAVTPGAKKVGKTPETVMIGQGNSDDSTAEIEPDESVASASIEKRRPATIERAVRANNAPKTPMPAGKDSLKLTFSGESWLSVQGADDQRLAFGMQKEGTVRKIAGTAPFQVFLGNALKVKLEFNGKPFDPEPFRRDNNTARFILKNP